MEEKKSKGKRKVVQQLPVLYSALNLQASNILQEINLNLSKRAQLYEEDWLELEQKINQVYHSFTTQIMQDFPLLTKDDLHIIILLRIGVSHEDIARLYNIQLSSFRKRRARLKQKMNIECESISQFIQKIYTS
ncbi:MAG: hypothetical protein IJZ86_06755 [Bacteroides sp.]|nr:hypothetical protein [Bacteroides sp.]